MGLHEVSPQDFQFLKSYYENYQMTSFTRNISKFLGRRFKDMLTEKPFKIIERDGNINIIFVLPASEKPAGGSIVTHHHSLTINKLGHKGFQSQVIYPAELQYDTNKFNSQSIYKRDPNFDKDKDFVLIPEMMACRYAPIFLKLGIKYGIHVQNGYSLGLEVLLKIDDFSTLKHVYEAADLIIANSEDTLENVKTVFPDVSEKIIRSYFVINKAKYQQVENKQNIITYMPRKLGKHSALVLLFLGDKLPANWSIKAIDGVTEQEVYDIFYESKIFLSFSEFEGLAMPPAMAAMSGNKVIGYTGEANKEYFHLPCFEEVYCGDIKEFVRKILAAVERFDAGEENLDLTSIDYLKDLFSEERQQSFIRELVEKVDEKLSQS